MPSSAARANSPLPVMTAMSAGGLPWVAWFGASLERKRLRLAAASGDPALAHLELEGGPCDVRQLDDGIGFEPAVVAVVPDGFAAHVGQRPSVRGEVPHAEVLEDQPERLPVVDEPLGDSPRTATGSEGSAK